MCVSGHNPTVDRILKSCTGLPFDGLLPVPVWFQLIAEFVTITNVIYRWDELGFPSLANVRLEIC